MSLNIWVIPCSVVVMHLGLVHFFIPTSLSGSSILRFSTSLPSLMMLTDISGSIYPRIKHNKRVQFESLFKADDSRPEMIATFLAVLEMIKLNKLYADYDEKSDDFILTTEKKNG